VIGFGAQSVLAREVTDRALDQRQKARMDREVIPIAIQGRGEEERAARADRGFDECGGAIREAREDLAIGGGGGRAEKRDLVELRVGELQGS